MHTEYGKHTKWLAGVVWVAGTLLPATAYAQSASDISALRKEVSSLRASQQEMEKNIKIIKDILMGKQPPLEGVYVTTAGAQSMGDAKAKVILVEFSDYQCAFCALRQ
jgi:protein-disulfide isomerase